MSSRPSSNLSLPIQEERAPWSALDVACYGIIALLAYMMSPPWVTLFFKVCHAPSVVFDILTIFYAPVSALRQNFHFIDMLYCGYRDLLKPWIRGG